MYGAVSSARVEAAKHRLSRPHPVLMRRADPESAKAEVEEMVQEVRVEAEVEEMVQEVRVEAEEVVAEEAAA